MFSATTATTNERHPRATGLVRLLAWACALAVIWLVVLPWLAGTRRMQRELDWLDQRGIDPSAMYYTELEAMKPILRRVNDRLRPDRAGHSAQPPAARDMPPKLPANSR